jgi:hypothetical protein
VQQIADWLEKLGMSEYAQRFAENRVDFAVLRDLTDQDLKDLGIVLDDHRQTSFGGPAALAWRNTTRRHLRKIGSRSSIYPLGISSHRPKMPSGLHLRHGDVDTFEWDFVTTGSDGQKVRTAGCDLLRFVGDKVATKNAFHKVRG